MSSYDRNECDMKTVPLLQKLVSIPSVFPNELKLSQFIEVYLIKMNFQVIKITTDKNRLNLVATNGKSRKYLGFYGHIDTVPPDKNYSFNPFTVKISHGIARGLGVVDMKGGISVILKLAEYAKKNSLPVKLVFGVDEENISQGAHDLVASGLLKNIDFMIVAESGQVKNPSQPLSACFGRKGRFVFDIEVAGKKAHAAESSKGINALEKASLLINEIKKIKLPADKYFGQSDIIFQKISAESDSFSIPDTCSLQLSLLTNSKVRSEFFIKKVCRIANKLNMKISIKPHIRNTPYGESYVINTKNSFLQEIVGKIILPNKITPIYTESVADENVFANRLKIPVLTMGAIGGGDHTKDEWVKIDSLEKLLYSYITILNLYNKHI